MRKCLLFLFVIFFLSPLWSLAEEKIALIKTPEDAEKIGGVIAEVLYGKERSEKQKPYTARLDGDLWVVKGTLHYNKGGVFEIKINKFDGAVINFAHGK
ncbi:NTF2 fold immunity protein [Pseudomonas capsici]|uniref:NTF2 fold immunity protein n=1 Tax=Pseudomonas capsici TaxID=2810614 RepID=UPI00403AA0F4